MSKFSSVPLSILISLTVLVSQVAFAAPPNAPDASPKRSARKPVDSKSTEQPAQPDTDKLQPYCLDGTKMFPNEPCKDGTTEGTARASAGGKAPYPKDWINSQ